MTFDFYRLFAHTVGRGLLLSLFVAIVLTCLTLSVAQQKEAHATGVLVLGHPSGKTITLSPKQFAKLPRTTIKAKAPHSDQATTYEGVLLGRLLKEAGVEPVTNSSGTFELPRSLRASYVLVEAVDGYQIVYSLQEAIVKLGGGRILVADRENGQPLQANAAPYRIIVPGSTVCERWVRQVRRILVQPASASPLPAKSIEGPKPTTTADVKGKVYLVGTGPGDPELITVKAARILKAADVVFCYHWMKDELAPFVRPGTVEVISPALHGGRYFGRPIEKFPKDQRAAATAAQEELKRLKATLAKLTAQGKTVAFADNGDPMLFSPWGWATEYLNAFDIEVIPGLSSFNAANAAIKKSVACGGYVTLSSGAELGTPDAKGRLAGTLVFFTHRTKLETLLPKLTARYPGDTPIAIVCDVSYPTEKVHHATLGTIDKVLDNQKLPHLYLFYIGDGIKQ